MSYCIHSKCISKVNVFEYFCEEWYILRFPFNFKVKGTIPVMPLLQEFPHDSLCVSEMFDKVSKIFDIIKQN